ncbi:amidase family protein [Deinococcus rubellus]|uniref:Amidase family protein n=1 Tax=Deinococcus rubellus TaxID=1889240 RepID=A0ABY5YIH8_9DEIO|nr:amidase family protein [Deinococcus rubellus]UWX64920.1 amidase family protein [Deinococcus rubellus]
MPDLLPDPALLELDATDLIAAVAAGRASAADAARLYLARIEARNPVLHAVITVNPQALEEAGALDQLPPDQRGPLHGLPLLIKDNIDVAGLPTTAGSALMAGHLPGADAPLVARLRAAGAVVLGKANMTEWANFMTVEMPNGYSSRGGQTINPWQVGADTGGSSSGSGAAVAARLAPAAIGTETSGSILSPAHQNGVIGHKPTVGLIPRVGVVPISPTQDTAGPLTRTARDAALLSGVMAGPDAADPATAAATSQVTSSQGFGLQPDALRGAKIGVVRGGFWKHLTSEQCERLDAALTVLKAGGAELTDVEIESEPELRTAGFEVLLYEFKPALNAYLAGVTEGPGSLEAVIAASDADPQRLQRHGMLILQAAQATRGDLSERAYEEARARDLDLAGARGLLPLFSGCEALIFPGYSGYAPAAKLGLPSVNVPIGLAAGKPTGLQLCGPAWSDARLLSLAADLHARLGGFVAAPEPQH